MAPSDSIFPFLLQYTYYQLHNFNYIGRNKITLKINYCLQKENKIDSKPFRCLGVLKKFHDKVFTGIMGGKFTDINQFVQHQSSVSMTNLMILETAYLLCFILLIDSNNLFPGYLSQYKHMTEAGSSCLNQISSFLGLRIFNKPPVKSTKPKFQSSPELSWNRSYTKQITEYVLDKVQFCPFLSLFPKSCEN